jgi:hypothetical protein
MPETRATSRANDDNLAQTSGEPSSPVQTQQPTSPSLPASVSVITSYSGSTKLLPPTAFYGDSPARLREFITQVRLIFRRYPGDFPTEESKVIHAVSYLRDTAFAWVQPHLEKEPPPTWLTNFDLFAEKLGDTFGEPDYLLNVGIDLTNLRQTSSVVEYVTEFRRLSTLLSTWHEDTFILLFYRGLKEPIQAEVFKAKCPDKMDELIRLASYFEKRLQPPDNHASTAKSPRTASKRTNDASATAASATGVLESSPPTASDRPYCTHHRSYSHATADCRFLRKQATTGNGPGLSPTPTVTERDSQTRRPHIQTGATTSVASARTDLVTDRRIIVPAGLVVKDKKVPVSVLLDSGSSSSLIDIDFAQQHHIPIQRKDQPTSLEGIDGLAVASGTITHETALIQMDIDDHAEMIQFDVVTLGHYPIVLGIPWFLLHSPTIRWHQRCVKFDSYHCQAQCRELSSKPKATTDKPPITEINTPSGLLLGDRSLRIPESAKQRDINASHTVRAGAATTQPLRRPISTAQRLDRSPRCLDPIQMLPREHAQPQHVLHTAAATHTRKMHTHDMHTHTRNAHIHAQDSGQHQLASHGHPMVIPRAQPPCYGQNLRFFPTACYGSTNAFGQTFYGGYWHAPQPLVCGSYPIPVLHSMSNAEGGNVIWL